MSKRRALVAVGCTALIASIVLCLTPVTIRPASVLPGPLYNALPSAFKSAEASCGSVGRPHHPEFSGVLSAISSLMRTECTSAVRDRMWIVVWVAVGGISMILFASFLFPRRRRQDREVTPAPLPPPAPRQAAPSPPHRRSGAPTVVIGTLLAITSLIACGNDGPVRSTAAFCSTLKSEQSRILAQFNATSSGDVASGDEFAAALLGIGASLQALGELRTYFHKLADVAPAQVQTEADLVADWYDDQVKSAKDAVKDPLGTVAGSLLGGIMISGQMDTLNKFAMQECGQSI